MLADGAATVAELAALLAPWPYTDPRETWAQHSVRLHRDEPAKMAALAEAMRSAGRWLGPPLAWVGPFVQDGHHRLVTAMCLGWHGRTVPAEPVTAMPDLADYIAELHGLLRAERPAPRVVLPAGTVVWPLAGLERRAPLVRQAADALGVRRAR